MVKRCGFPQITPAKHLPGCIKLFRFIHNEVHSIECSQKSKKKAAKIAAFLKVRRLLTLPENQYHQRGGA